MGPQRKESGQGFGQRVITTVRNVVSSALTHAYRIQLRVDEVVWLSKVFELVRNGDHQGKANVAAFIHEVRNNETKDILFTSFRAGQMSKEFGKLADKTAKDSSICSMYKTWAQMVEFIHTETLLILKVNRPEVVRAISSGRGGTSSASSSSASSAPQILLLNRESPTSTIPAVREYRSLLESKGVEFADADHDAIQDMHEQKRLLVLKIQQYEGGNSANRIDQLATISSRVDQMMVDSIEQPVADPSVEMDAIFAVDHEAELASAAAAAAGAMDVEDVVEGEGAAAAAAANQARIDAGIALRLTPLTAEQRGEATAILNAPPTEELLTEKYGITMSRKKMACLRPSTWLNDEVINFYMELLQDRDRALCNKDSTRKSSHYFNSFFMAKLLDTGDKCTYTYDAVKRWTKRFDIFAKRRIYFPVNIRNTHWTHLVVHMETRQIHYYDSMGSDGSMYQKAILRWIGDEAKVKKGWDTYDLNCWTLVDHGGDIPQQSNGFDCGVFSCIFADFDTDDLPFNFAQVHMPNFRLKICLDVVRGELTYPV